MVNNPNAAQAPNSGQGDRAVSAGSRCCRQHVDDAAEQDRLRELRYCQQQIGAGKQPAETRLLAEQVKNANVKADKGHG